MCKALRDVDGSIILTFKASSVTLVKTHTGLQRE